MPKHILSSLSRYISEHRHIFVHRDVYRLSFKHYLDAHFRTNNTTHECDVFSSGTTVHIRDQDPTVTRNDTYPFENPVEVFTNAAPAALERAHAIIFSSSFNKQVSSMTCFISERVLRRCSSAIKEYYFHGLRCRSVDHLSDIICNILVVFVAEFAYIDQLDSS